MHYTLRQLQVFMAVARLENVTRAADALAMSQSAASSAVKELESQYDMQLFDRIGKRLQLNEHGKTLRPQVEALLAQAQELESALAGKHNLGTLKLGATITIGDFLAVDLIAQYMREQSGARVELKVANTQTIVDQVLHFELDLGLIEGELNHTELDVIEWLDDQLVLFASPELVPSSQVMTDRALKQLDWIVRETGSGTRQAFDRAMQGLLPELNIVLELQHTEAIKQAVKQGLGVGCLSAISVQEELANGELVLLQAPHRHWSRKFYFVLHKHKYHNPEVAAWLALCREYTPQPMADISNLGQAD
jgi:DNA-binding transcriptional LysR family regulator